MTWRQWRHSRPFWGGTLLVLAGLELLAIPLSGVLAHGAIKLVIYIGIGGVFGILIGVLLIASGVLLLADPVHRLFYGVAGVVLGILSFPASNLGGFFIGMLLAITGGSLAYAWSPLGQSPAAAIDEPREQERPQASGPAPTAPAPAQPAGAPADGGPVAGGIGSGGFGSGSAASADDDSDDAGPPWGRAPKAREEGDTDALGLITGDLGARHGLDGNGAHRLLAIAVMPMVLVAGLLGSTGARAQAAAMDAAQPSQDCILGLICLPGPSPSPSTSVPQPSPTPDPAATGTPNPGPSGTGSPGTGQHGSHKSKKAKQKYGTDSGLVASSATSVISAGAATLSDFNYQGVVNMPVGGGGTVKMLEFTANSISMTGGVTATVTQNGVTTRTTSPSFDFSGNVVLYATKLSGCLSVTPVCVTMTPGSIENVLGQLAGYLTDLVPLTLTRVVTDQPLASAGALQAGTLSLSLGG